MPAAVSVVKCKDYALDSVQQALDRALELLGGLNSFIRPQTRVLVKPNLLMAKPPEFAITTHPQILRAVVRALKRIGCRITVADGPSVWGNQIENIDKVYEVTGIARVCAEEEVSLISLEKRRMRKYFPLAALLDECDYVVNLPKFKTHELTVLTGAVKNLFGLVSGTFKTELHKSHFQPQEFSQMLTDVLEEVRPALTVVDAVTAMEGDGPATSGRPKHVGLVIAGSDCVALDSVMARIMGVEPQQILTTKEAAARGLGIADLKKIQILGEKLEDLKISSFVLPTSATLRSRIPRPLVNLLKTLVRYRPFVLREKCVRCSACVDACPKKVITLKEEGICFEYSGCIACFCCQEACPASAIRVKKSL